MDRRLPRLLVLAAVVLMPAWLTEGHRLVTRAAVERVRGQLPAFFAAGADRIGHCAQDPDVFKTKQCAQLLAQEYPEHYLDREFLAGAALPATRPEFIALCQAKGVQPGTVGYLPYAVAEWAQRLTVAFAEHRRWPDNPHIQQKVLVYAGQLSHYAADLCQPLHLTIHYDGRAKPDGTSPKTGLHRRVDALLVKVAESRPKEGDEARPYPVLWAAITGRLDEAAALVERVYALEGRLPEEAAPITDPELEAFARERRLAVERFLADLYLTAWTDSTSLTLPEWLDRGRDEDRGSGR